MSGCDSKNVDGGVMGGMTSSRGEGSGDIFNESNYHCDNIEE
jgi:hypothetical protein